MPATQTEIMLKVIEALEGIDSPYLVGGSYASSAYGIARATMDIDILAAIPAKHAGLFAASLESEFYADVEAIRHAIQNRRSFNVIHLDTMFKVDVFVSKRDPFDTKQLERRKLQIVVREPERAIYVSSPEDIVLAKLRWYRQTDERSERQWSDVLGVMTVQGAKLDVEYLRQWSHELNVSDLLERALSESQGEEG